MLASKADRLPVQLAMPQEERLGVAAGAAFRCSLPPTQWLPVLRRRWLALCRGGVDLQRHRAERCERHRPAAAPPAASVRTAGRRPPETSTAGKREQDAVKRLRINTSGL